MHPVQVFRWWIAGRGGLLTPTPYRCTEAEIRQRHPEAQRISFDWAWRDGPARAPAPAGNPQQGQAGL